MWSRPFVLIAVLMVVAGCGWKDHVDSRAATAGLPDARQLVQEHEWVLEGAESSITVDDDNPVTLSVVDDLISGMAPCNAYSGDISLTDDAVEISAIALTRRGCSESTMEAEEVLITALEAVDTVDVDEGDNDDRLVLHDGDVHMVFRPYDADEILTATWTIVDVTTDGTVDGLLAGTEPTLTFTDDGNLMVEAGCNSGTSDWELEGHALSIEPVRLTRMACDSPAGVMDQEAAIVTALETADRIEIAPTELVIIDADHSVRLVAARG